MAAVAFVPAVGKILCSIFASARLRISEGQPSLPQQYSLPTLQKITEFLGCCASSIISGLRATKAAMRSTVFKGLLWHGYSFIFEPILGHAKAEDTLEARHADPEEPITVDRIASPVSSVGITSLGLSVNKDYELVWRDGPLDYITSAGFACIVSLLRAWADDIEADNITRRQNVGPIIDAGSRTETRLSTVLHKYMLERCGPNTEEAWREAIAKFSKALSATERWMSAFYSSTNFNDMKVKGIVPGDAMRGFFEPSWDDYCDICVVGDFLAFSIMQTDQWRHPGMRLSQISMMKMLVDLDAFHRQRPVPSFVRVEKVRRHPGYLYDEENCGIVQVSAEKLQRLWRRGKVDGDGGYSQRNTRACRVFAEGFAESARRAKMVSAAATSIKSARRSRTGSRSLLVTPTQSLLCAKYRKISDARAGITYDAFNTTRKFHIPVKRSAEGLADGLRDSKRGRLEKRGISDFGPYERAVSSLAAATAAAIPLPPSPAASESTSDDENDIRTGETAVEIGYHNRIPWKAVFPQDEEPNTPHLRISDLKAEELRLIVERKRAAREAARLKRQEELRRREEERRRKEEEERLASSGLRLPARQVISPLSESWRCQVINAARADPTKDIAKSPEGTALKSKDFRTVVSKSEWLNDEIVNGFLLHLANYINTKAGISNPKTQVPKCHAFTSFFWKTLSTRGAAGTERWMKRVGITKDNFLKIDTILIPICEHSHWTLVVIRPKIASVTHMDSLGSNGAGRRAVTDVVMGWIKELTKDKYSDKWRVQHYDSPRQTNGWDCGVHAITNAMFMALGLDPSSYRSTEMPLQRDRIAATLINGGFTGDLDLSGL